jgi:hypothetical protein
MLLKTKEIGGRWEMKNRWQVVGHTEWAGKSQDKPRPLVLKRSSSGNYARVRGNSSSLVALYLSTISQGQCAVLAESRRTSATKRLALGAARLEPSSRLSLFSDC